MSWKGRKHACCLLWPSIILYSTINRQVARTSGDTVYCSHSFVHVATRKTGTQPILRHTYILVLLYTCWACVRVVNNPLFDHGLTERMAKRTDKRVWFKCIRLHFCPRPSVLLCCWLTTTGRGWASYHIKSVDQNSIKSKFDLLFTRWCYIPVYCLLCCKVNRNLTTSCKDYERMYLYSTWLYRK